jgi:hypothetical protein
VTVALKNPAALVVHNSVRFCEVPRMTLLEVSEQPRPEGVEDTARLTLPVKLFKGAIVILVKVVVPANTVALDWASESAKSTTLRETAAELRKSLGPSHAEILIE